MIRIDQTEAEYNDNLLPVDYTFENVLTWYNSVGGSTTVAVSTEQHFEGSKSLKINHPQFDVLDIIFRPTSDTDFLFTVPRTGKYLLSFRAYLKNQAMFFPEVIGYLHLYKNGDINDYQNLSLAIGNNTEPEFSFNYIKWQTFYSEINLVAGDTINMNFGIINSPTFTPGLLELYLDGFKIEYITDRVQSLPSLYSKPL